MPWLAHSGRTGTGIPAQTYADHVRAVVRLARESGAAVGRWQQDPEFLSALGVSAAWHDLGKLDPKNQTVLRSKPRERLAVQHEYAGVRHLREQGQGTAATLVYAHHGGLPNLTGVLSESIPLDDKWEESTRERSDGLLSDMLRNHCEAVPDASAVS